MDKFIGCILVVFLVLVAFLKSNMDRFIECMCAVSVAPLCNLKSNMDRFIDVDVVSVSAESAAFKIQYG